MSIQSYPSRLIIDTISQRNEYQLINEIFNDHQFINYLEKKYEKKIDVKTKIFIPEDNLAKDIRTIIEKKSIHLWTILYIKHCKIQYINSGTTGHFFKGYIHDPDTNEIIGNFGLKVTMYSDISYKNLSIYDATRPENVEIIISHILGELVKQGKTPHIILPVASFYTSLKPFITIKCDGKNSIINDNKDKYKKFIEAYHKEHRYNQETSINITEYANRGDLLDYIKKYYKDMSPLDWKIFLFQIISTLAVIQLEYPAFKHNDLKANNILLHEIKKTSKFVSYDINRKKYLVNNNGFIIKIWDFDFACIGNLVSNRKVLMEWANKCGINNKKNRYYDLHYFLVTLISKSFCGDIIKNVKDSELHNFINRIIPIEYRNYTPDDLNNKVNSKNRLIHNEELYIPIKIIEEDPYFECFRTNSSEEKQI